MGKYLVRNMRNYIFRGKFFLPFITSGSLWIPYYPFNAFNSEAKVFFLFCMSVSAVLYWRRETLKIMTVPGNEFFNLGAFEKYRKEEYEAFINLIDDQLFSFEKLKEELKIPNITEKYYTSTESRINEHKTYIYGLEQTIDSKNEDIQDLKNQLDMLRDELQKNQQDDSAVKTVMEELEQALKVTQKEKEVYSSIVRNSQRNMQMFVDKDFHSDVLREMNFDYDYSVYQLNRKNEYEYLTSSGVNEHLMEKQIIMKEKSNVINRAHTYKGKTAFGESTVAKLIPISLNKKIVVQLHLSDEDIEILNNELHELNKTAKIKIESTFNLFWTCLLIQHSVDEIKNRLKGAENVE
ncbi:hypothetical protein ACQCV8_02255 [Metabacillus sp. 84]